MRMKIAVGFVHTLIIMKILVLSCALHISKFCVVIFSSHAMYAEYFKTFQNVLPGGRVVNGTYFKVRGVARIF